MHICTRNYPKNSFSSPISLSSTMKIFCSRRTLKGLSWKGHQRSTSSKPPATGMKTSIMVRFPQYPQNYTCVVHISAHAGFTPGMYRHVELFCWFCQSELLQCARAFHWLTGKRINVGCLPAHSGASPSGNEGRDEAEVGILCNTIIKEKPLGKNIIR